jgi:hypothetical protein
MRSGAASRLRTEVTGAVRLGKGADREVESEEADDQKPDPTNVNRIQGRRRMGNPAMVGRADCQSDNARVNDGI